MVNSDAPEAYASARIRRNWLADPHGEIAESGGTARTTDTTPTIPPGGSPCLIRYAQCTAMSQGQDIRIAPHAWSGDPACQDFARVTRCIFGLLPVFRSKWFN